MEIAPVYQNDWTLTSTGYENSLIWKNDNFLSKKFFLNRLEHWTVDITVILWLSYFFLWAINDYDYDYDYLGIRFYSIKFPVVFIQMASCYECGYVSMTRIHSATQLIIWRNAQSASCDIDWLEFFFLLKKNQKKNTKVMCTVEQPIYLRMSFVHGISSFVKHVSFDFYSFKWLRCANIFPIKPSSE